MSRVVGVDVARCLALLGMVVAHLREPYDATAPAGVDALFQVVAGRSSALFAVLAGVSLVLAHPADGPRGGLTQDRAALTVRAGLVALLGLLLGIPATGVAVILTYYGVLFLLALPVLRWSARSLGALALAWGIASPVVSHLLRPHLPPPTYQVPSPLSLSDPLQLLSELTVTGYYPVLTWATYLFAGMAAGRLVRRRPSWGKRLALWGAWLAVAALSASLVATRHAGVRSVLLGSYEGVQPVSGWASLETVLRHGFYGTAPTGSWWWLGVWAPHSGTWADLAHTTGTALLVLGLAVWLVDDLAPIARRPCQVVFGAGTMTLTLYATHVVVLALPGALPLTHDLRAHVLGLLTVGAVFGALRARGPLELLVSRASRAAAADTHSQSLR